jgi:hypothetical protein
MCVHASVVGVHASNVAVVVADHLAVVLLGSPVVLVDSSLHLTVVAFNFTVVGVDLPLRLLFRATHRAPPLGLRSPLRFTDLTLQPVGIKALCHLGLCGNVCSIIATPPHCR